MLETKNRRYDNALVYHLKRVKDWLVFGSVGFRKRISQDKLKQLFYKLIRPVEHSNQGQFVVRFEGDNKTRDRHFHFLLRDKGLVSNDINVINSKLEDNIKNLSFDHDEFTSSTNKFVKYNPKLGAIGYISKIANDEVERLEGRGLDSCVAGMDWKMSSKLKRDLMDMNQTLLQNY